LLVAVSAPCFAGVIEIIQPPKAIVNKKIAK